MGDQKITEVSSTPVTAKETSPPPLSSVAAKETSPSILPVAESQTEKETKRPDQSPVNVKPSTKTSAITVDKLIVKTLVVDDVKSKKPKPHIKLKSQSGVENKAFKTELFGEETKSSESQSGDSGGIIDTIKDMILGSFIGKKVTAAGGIGAAVKGVISAGATGLGAIAPVAALGLATQQAGSADMNDKEQTNIFSSVARFGKNMADKWNSFTGGPNKDAQIKRIQENIEERGAKYTPEEAKDIKEKLGYQIPESALSISTKPTMLEQSSQEIPKATERIEAKAKELGTQPVIIQQNTTQQEAPPPTVIPIKGSIRPNESAFNRFQDKTFKA